MPAREIRRTEVARRAADVERRFLELTTVPLRRGMVAATAALALAAAATLHHVLVAGVVLVVVVLFALGWMRLLGLPSRRRGIPVITAVGVTALVVTTWTVNPDHLVLTTAFAVVAAFLLEMGRGDGRPRLVEDVSGLVAGSVVTVCGAGWVTVAEARPVLATTAALVVALVSLLAALPLPGRRVMVFAPVVGALAALAGHVLAADLLSLSGPDVRGHLVALGLGAALGLVTGTVQVILSWLPSSGRKRPAAAAALTPVLLMGVPLELVATYVS